MPTEHVLYGGERSDLKVHTMAIVSILIISVEAAAILLSIEAGHRLGLRRNRNIEGTSSTLAASVFGLMALLVAFTFYGAASRFDIRRNLIVEEADYIGTAYLRLDLLPLEAQHELREDFRKYLTSRVATFHKVPDLEAVKAELARSEVLQQEIWKKAVAGTRTSNPATQQLVLSAINQMIDITNAATVALTTHPPTPVFAMLGLSVIVSSLLAGYAMSTSRARDWVSIIAFASLLSTTVYVIIDYEFPRIGIIRIDPVDEVLVHTLEEMK
jgi:hypothetical protein